MNNADEIKRLLAGDDGAEAEEKEESKVPVRIPISRGTLEKAHTICKIVSVEAGSPHEWFSFLLASKSDPEYIVRDLLIVKGTKAQPGHVEVDGEMHAQAATEVAHLNQQNKTDYYTIGWLHSHGSGKPGHSNTDNQNFAQLLNSISLNTEQRVDTPLNLIESAVSRKIDDGLIVVSGEELEDAVITYKIPDRDEFNSLLQKH